MSTHATGAPGCTGPRMVDGVPQRICSCDQSVGAHRDDRFPAVESDHACSRCRLGQHQHCPIRVVDIGYEFRCACYLAAVGAHDALAPRELADAAAIAAELRTVFVEGAVSVEVLAEVFAEVLASRGYRLVTPRLEP